VPDVDAATELRHVMVVGGTLAEWSAMSTTQWDPLVAALGGYCGERSIGRLTLRVYAAPGDQSSGSEIRRYEIAGCEVTVDPCGDGRQRFAEAMNHLDVALPISEKAVASALYGSAAAEPDLLVVLGPDTQLPPSLVWELAYAELVFLDCAWAELGVDELESAIHEFRSRNRRFGGLDDE
jgi:hypothetical protein